jgi:mono/diheme cytochrome c family protein
MTPRLRRLCVILAFAAGPAALFAADTGAAGRTAPPWENPIREGRSLYLDNCSVCHTIDGPKQGKKLGPSLYRLFQNEKLPLSHGKPTDVYVTGKIKGGGFVMPSFRTYLSDAQIRMLLTYIRSRQ